MGRNEYRPLTLFNSNIDNPFHDRSLECLKLTFLEMEGKLKEAERNYKKAQKDYYIRFMIESVNRIENKKVAEKRTTREERITKKKTKPSRSKN